VNILGWVFTEKVTSHMEKIYGGGGDQACRAQGSILPASSDRPLATSVSTLRRDWTLGRKDLATGRLHTEITDLGGSAGHHSGPGLWSHQNHLSAFSNTPPHPR
jgi:hypothetical protein